MNAVLCCHLWTSSCALIRVCTPASHVEGLIIQYALWNIMCNLNSRNKFRSVTSDSAGCAEALFVFSFVAEVPSSKASELTKEG